MALGASAGPLISYVVSRSVGLPLEHREEVGNWTEPLGLASLAVEGVVVLIAAGALARLTRAERMPSGAPAVATPLA